MFCAVGSWVRGVRKGRWLGQLCLDGKRNDVSLLDLWLYILIPFFATSFTYIVEHCGTSTLLSK